MNDHHLHRCRPAFPLSRRGVFALLLCLLAGPVAAAGEGVAEAAGVRTQDQVWLISTRHLGCASPHGQPAVWQWENSTWLPSDAAAFHKDNASWPVTVLYIHGNRIDDNEGASGGLAVYQQIVGARADERPVRFAIWSWPSTKICGPIKDVRSKAWQSDDEAIMLAHFLAPIDNPQARVGIVAFSYGARITGGALHMLGGGELDGYVAPAGERPKFRVAFWAAAAHNNWLLPNSGYRHNMAMSLGEKWLNLINGCDESLWRYERLEKCGNPPSLGYVGLAGRHQLPVDFATRWEEWQVSNLVGTTHNYHPYVYSPWVAQRTAEVVLGLNNDQ